MTRIAVFGFGPMRWESSTRLFALPLRTWHFANALGQAGHEVLLFAVRLAAQEGWPVEKITHTRRGRVSVWSLSEHVFHERPEVIEEKMAEFRAQAVVGVNRDPAALAVNFARDLPLWADINGDPMAEAQVKASALGGDWNVNEWYRKLCPVLGRADHFSTCSRAQAAALVGQLGMLGRLTAKNDGYDFVSAIPNSIDDEELEHFGMIQRRRRKRGDRFMLLWSGGYNTWTDPDVLFRAVEGAMDEAPELHFVSTGGAIVGHHEDAFDRFAASVKASKNRERYDFAGWVASSDLAAYYADADAAILVDRFSYEGLLGARTRMLDWLAAGLPIVCTRLSEISTELEAAGAAITVECGQPEALTRGITRLLREPERAAEMGLAGRRLARERYRAAQQLEPLLAWARRPTRAPDLEHRVGLSWAPSALTKSRQLASMVRRELREHGARGTVVATGRFAARRLQHGASRILGKLGVVEPLDAAESESVDAGLPAEAPRHAGFEWRDRFRSLPSLPRVSVVMPLAADTPAHVLEWTVAQLPRQYLVSSGVLVVELGEPHAALETLLADLDARVGSVVERVRAGSVDVRGHRLVTSSDFVALLAPGTLLRPDALAELVWEALEQDADLVYADDQYVDESNVPEPPRRKPDFDPDLFLAADIVGGVLLCRTSSFELSEKLAELPPRAMIYDAALRMSERARRVVHVPCALSQIWRDAVRDESELVQSEQALALHRLDSVRDALWRRGDDGTVTRGPGFGLLRVRHAAPVGPVPVWVLDTGPAERVERCRASLEKLAPRRVKVGVVSANKRDTAVRLPGKAGLCVVVDPGVEAFREDWLEELLSELGRPDVAAVSPRIYSPRGEPLFGGSSQAGLASLMENVVHEVEAPSALCFAMRDAWLKKESVPLDAGERAAWLAERSRAFRGKGQRALYTPHAVLHYHPSNGHSAATGGAVTTKSPESSERRARRDTH